MKTYESFGALARALERAAARLPETYATAMAAGAESVKQEAQARIGHRQPGWQELADSTLAEKARLGYAGVPLPGGDGDQNPLLRTGGMRDSIKAESSEAGFVVGSADEVLAYQELGTARMPARPVLGPALLNTAPALTEVLGGAIERTLAGEE